jgi:hypothetical protein
VRGVGYRLRGAPEDAAVSAGAGDAPGERSHP